MSPSAREVALEAIRRVTDEGAYSNRVLPAALARSGLDERDRALATELAYGTIRHAPGLDDAIGARAARPVERMTPGARAALRLGAYQILHTRIPAHAAVGETVGIVVPRERGFVNAILRRLAKEPPAPPAGRDDRAISLRTGMAPWAIARAPDAPPARRGRGGRGRFRRASAAHPAREHVPIDPAGGPGHPPSRRAWMRRVGPVHPACILVAGGDPTALPGWNEGRFAVQDQASAFVVDALAPEPGDRVLDACAAPGGKTAFVACRVGEEGRVVAGGPPAGTHGADREPARAARVSARLSSRTTPPDPPSVVPSTGCSSTLPARGIGSRAPAARAPVAGRRDELSRLARLQVAIAAAAADLLRPGGRLVYSVCTFPRAETDAACDAILRHRPDLVPIDHAGAGRRGSRRAAPSVAASSRHGRDVRRGLRTLRLTPARAGRRLQSAHMGKLAASILVVGPGPPGR